MKLAMVEEIRGWCLVCGENGKTIGGVRAVDIEVPSHMIVK